MSSRIPYSPCARGFASFHAEAPNQLEFEFEEFDPFTIWELLFSGNWVKWLVLAVLEDLDGFKKGFVEIEWPFVCWFCCAGSRKFTDSSQFFVVEFRSLRFEFSTKNFVFMSCPYFGRFSTFWIILLLFLLFCILPLCKVAEQTRGNLLETRGQVRELRLEEFSHKLRNRICSQNTEIERSQVQSGSIQDSKYPRGHRTFHAEKGLKRVKRSLRLPPGRFFLDSNKQRSQLLLFALGYQRDGQKCQSRKVLYSREGPQARLTVSLKKKLTSNWTHHNDVINCDGIISRIRRLI